MRELTLRGFLTRYVRELSLAKTNSVYKLVKEACTVNVRLKEPLFLYALFAEKAEVLLQAAKNTDLQAEVQTLLEQYSVDEMTKALQAQCERLPDAYRKVWRSYLSVKNRVHTEADTKELMRKKLLRLQEKNGVSNYRIYTDLQLNPGNVNAWLKHGNSEKVSLNTARMMLRYVEQYADTRT